MSRLAFIVIVAFSLIGCKTDNTKPQKHSNSFPNAGKVQFADGFSLEDGDYITITVHNPWQHAREISFKYIFSDTLAASRRINENTWHIKTPVSKVICLSTTHVGFIEFLGCTESIKGISGREYIVNSNIRKALSENRVFDVGYDENLNIELILKLKPDVVFAYGVNASITNTINKLAELKIPVILIGEYLEQHPLAKLEWIKVFAACYGINNRITQKFDSVVGRYQDLALISMKAQSKPPVLLGLPWQGTWYISGSQSYMARLVKDAGATYIFDHFNFNESRPVALEKIYESALTAEYWINPGEARSIHDIISVDERFGTLPCVISKKIFNNDRYMVSSGNAIYEEGVTEPDIILSDLIKILHPQLLPSHNLKYYRKLE